MRVLRHSPRAYNAASFGVPRLLFLALLLVVVAPLRAQPSADLAAGQAWLGAQQQADGGWSDGLSERSGPGITAEVLLAWRALGDDPPPAAGDWLRDFTNQNITTFTPGMAAQAALGAWALGDDPRDFSSVDLLARAIEGETTFYGGTVYTHCQVVLAWRVAGETPPQGALEALRAAAHPDGGWGFMPDAPRDTTTTALCAQALHTTAAFDPGPALDYLRATQNPDGGWAFQRPSPFNTGSDAYSTAQVVMMLHTLGEDLAAWGQPDQTLAAFQTEDGAFDYTGVDVPAARVWATASALRALSGQSLFALSSD